MSQQDDYARKEARRDHAYKAAYQSDSAKAWIASLTPAQRAHAESLGLLSARLESGGSGPSLENLPASLEPRLEPLIDEGREALPFRKEEWGRIYDGLDGRRNKLLMAFLQQSGNPRLCWACLRYLFGHGTCESHAKALGMSKQNFHYHVRRIERTFGLSSMGNQRSGRSRTSYRAMNRRQGSLLTEIPESRQGLD